MDFVCPTCKAPVEHGQEAFCCGDCGKEFPVVCGIPDFRIQPDPYISIEDDRRKGERLERASRTRSFEQMLDHYYSFTSDDPPDLAEKWKEHSMVDQEIARAYLESTGDFSKDGCRGRTLLDLGCATGGMLLAASAAALEPVGVDVAFRWLVICRARLLEQKVQATLVCANAEYLPFRDSTFDSITALDLLEHVRDPALAVNEARRVSRPASKSFSLTNNRYGRLWEPHVGVWGVGFLPRAKQVPYVARKRPDLREYRIRLRSVRELNRIFRATSYCRVSMGPGSLIAPHKVGWFGKLTLAAYNRSRFLPGLRSLLRWIGPKLEILALADRQGKKNQ